MPDPTRYRLNNPEQLLTPALLVYPNIIKQNLQEAIRIAGSAERLRPHVKTHKTSKIVQMELELGITKHKCATLAEAQMLAECGAPDVLVSYPQVGPAVRTFVDLAARYPKTKFATVVEDSKCANALADYCRERKQVVDVLVDVDSGMHRTGTLPGEYAISLYAQISNAEFLNAGGLHVYDGQNHQPKREDRNAAVDALLEPVLRLVDALVANGNSVPKLVCGGTPTFPVYAQLQLPEGQPDIELSPGTCVLSDYNYGKDYADLGCIQHAAVLMTRVVSKQHAGRLTVDLGNKAVAADPPAGSRCHFLGIPDAKEIKQNEEHLILETDKADEFEVGDVLYALPAHICPTVALHSHVQVVEEGNLTGSWPVTARHRLYQVNN